MGTALKEAKESRTALMKLRLGNLDHAEKILKLELESEARQLSAIFATIIRNMKLRLEREEEERKRMKRRRPRVIRTRHLPLGSRSTHPAPAVRRVTACPRW